MSADTTAPGFFSRPSNPSHRQYLHSIIDGGPVRPLQGDEAMELLHEVSVSFTGDTRAYSALLRHPLPQDVLLWVARIGQQCLHSRIAQEILTQADLCPEGRFRALWITSDSFFGLDDLVDRDLVTQAEVDLVEQLRALCGSSGQEEAAQLGGTVLALPTDQSEIFFAFLQEQTLEGHRSLAQKSTGLKRIQELLECAQRV